MQCANPPPDYFRSPSCASAPSLLSTLHSILFLRLIYPYSSPQDSPLRSPFHELVVCLSIQLFVSTKRRRQSYIPPSDCARDLLYILRYLIIPSGSPNARLRNTFSTRRLSCGFGHPF